MADKPSICENRSVALSLRVHALVVPESQSPGFGNVAASCNTFNFKFGQMSISLLDLYAITSLPVSDRPYQEIDFEGEAMAFEADPNRRNFYKSIGEQVYKVHKTTLLAISTVHKFTHSPEAMHLFEQAISIADLRFRDDAGFELYAPNHIARQLGFQQEIPFPLFESVNMYTSWPLKRKGKKQIDDPRFQPNFTQFKVKVRSISLMFTSKEVSQTYNAWWSMICGELWTMDPLHLIIIIFANGRTLLPPHDQALKEEEDIPEPCQPSSIQTPQKRRREQPQDSEDEPEVSLVRGRRNATPTDVTILDHDPEEDDHITLNELLHNVLPVCHATPITTMDNSRHRIPFGPIEETGRNSRAEASNVPEEEDEIDLEISDVDATAEATSVREETIPMISELPNTTCSDPHTTSSPQTSIEAARMDALEIPSLAPEVVVARDLLRNLEQIDLADEECMAQISKAITTLRSCANE
ncbi:hypothetical protein ACLB2K_041978 [Fragaria x ananassa]